MINTGILQGNLTRDPEVRYTQGGTAIANFTIAHNRRWADQAGKPQEKVGFFDCDAWGKNAENISKFFQKGQQIVIQYELDYQSWEDKESGKERHAVKLKVVSWSFCGNKRDNEDAGDDRGESRREPAPSRSRRESPPRRAAVPPEERDDQQPGSGDDDDNIPF